MWTSVWSVMTTALAQTGEAATETTGQVNPFSQMLPMFILFIGIMYFLMIRPNQKREKQRREMLASLSKGDQVVTNGGVCGTVVGLSEKSVVLRVSDDPPVKIEFLRGAVSRVQPRGGDNDD